MRRLAVAICLLALPGAVACGGGDDKGDARTAAAGYVTALGKGNGAAACARMTKALQRQFLAAVSRLDKRFSGEPCQRAMSAALQTIPPDQLKRLSQAKIQDLKGKEDAGTFRYTLGQIRVNGRVAKEDGDWNVSCCVPGAGWRGAAAPDPPAGGDLGPGVAGAPAGLAGRVAPAREPHR